MPSSQKQVAKASSYLHRFLPPSSSSSSIATSYFSIPCNFNELAKEYPEFDNAWLDLRRRQQQQQPLPQQKRQQSQHLQNCGKKRKTTTHLERQNKRQCPTESLNREQFISSSGKHQHQQNHVARNNDTDKLQSHTNLGLCKEKHDYPIEHVLENANSGNIGHTGNHDVDISFNSKSLHVPSAIKDGDATTNEDENDIVKDDSTSATIVIPLGIQSHSFDSDNNRNENSATRSCNHACTKSNTLSNKTYTESKPTICIKSNNTNKSSNRNQSTHIESCIATSNNSNYSKSSCNTTSFSSQITHTFNAALTRSLLHRHFQLVMPSLPAGRLCPPVPNRANYVCWIRELMEETKKKMRTEEELANSDNANSTGDVVGLDGGTNEIGRRGSKMKNSEKSKQLQYQGIDIGTGVSAIYPLLLTTNLFAMSDSCVELGGSNDNECATLNANEDCIQQCHKNGGNGEEKSGDIINLCNAKHNNNNNNDNNNQLPTKWRFLATDIDALAVQSARDNVQANRLEDQICVVQVKALNKFTSSSSCANASGEKDASNLTAEKVPITKNIPNGPLFAAMEEAKHCNMFRKSGHNLPESKKHDHVEETSNYDTVPDREHDISLEEYPKFDFVMTNPPFYSSLKEASGPRVGDGRSRTDMSSNEGVYFAIDSSFDIGCEDCDIDGYNINIKDFSTIGESRNSGKEEEESGGDVGFVTDIMDDSQFFRHHITWYTSLLAKRSSLNAVLQKLHTLDGVWGNRGQVRMVEFRQGSGKGNNEDNAGRNADHNPRVRWGIGWTYERAVGRCSTCRVRGGLQSFDVWVRAGSDANPSSTGLDLTDRSASVQDDTRQACDKVASRISDFFESVRDVSLKCTNQVRDSGDHSSSVNSNVNEEGRMPCGNKKCVTAVEKRFYDCQRQQSSLSLLEHDEDNENLPHEGHFLIDAFVDCSGERNNAGQVRVQVSLEIYSHTRRGKELVDKIRGPMPGEIDRTNRRWRRIMKKATAAPTQQLG